MIWKRASRITYSCLDFSLIRFYNYNVIFQRMPTHLWDQAYSHPNSGRWISLGPSREWRINTGHSWLQIFTHFVCIHSLQCCGSFYFGWSTEFGAQDFQQVYPQQSRTPDTGYWKYCIQECLLYGEGKTLCICVKVLVILRDPFSRELRVLYTVLPP